MDRGIILSLFTNRLSIKSIHRCFAVPTRTQFSSRLDITNKNPCLVVFARSETADLSVRAKLMKTCMLQSKLRGLFNDKNRETIGEIYLIVYIDSHNG